MTNNTSTDDAYGGAYCNTLPIILTKQKNQ